MIFSSNIIAPPIFRHTLARQGLGYAGISNMLAVEFDTYYNAEMLEPYENHVSVQTRCGELSSLLVAQVCAWSFGLSRCLASFTCLHHGVRLGLRAGSTVGGQIAYLTFSFKTWPFFLVKLYWPLLFPVSFCRMPYGFALAYVT